MKSPGSTDVLSGIDHLVYAAPGLEIGIRKLEDLLGIQAIPGGQHPRWGTKNALISLGPATYLEVIGPDADQPPPNEPRPFGIDGLQTPRLVTWAAKSSDLEKLSDQALAQGITLGGVSAGSRRRADGIVLTWRLTDPMTVLADGLVPFFIDWGTTPHPAQSAAQGARLIGLRAEHPQPEPVRKMLQQLGLALTVSPGSKPALIATLSSPKGEVELR